MSRGVSLILAGAASAVLLGASFGIASSQFEPGQRVQERDEVRLGTYEPQMVFQTSPHAIRLQERVGQLQQQAQEAQEQGDHQRAMQVQNQMQTVQNEVIQEFLAEVEEALPEIAREKGVQIVALQVVWTEERIGEPTDLSRDLIERLSNDDDGPAAPPFMPPGQ